MRADWSVGGDFVEACADLEKCRVGRESFGEPSVERPQRCDEGTGLGRAFDVQVELAICLPPIVGHRGAVRLHLAVGVAAGRVHGLGDRVELAAVVMDELTKLLHLKEERDPSGDARQPDELVEGSFSNETSASEYGPG